jgi:hypothetical protein
MKLNIGCGWNYLPGWTNLDSSPESAADRLMPAHDLDLPPSSAAEIRAQQLIEHLGFFRAKYFLSECWRVLAPGGVLTLETPDIEKTFRVFLDGDHAAKEAALGWVYGAETPGMNHLYCFPKELLTELLAEAGFRCRQPEEFMFQPARPALRFSAVKEAGELPALNAALRRRLLDKGLAEFASEETSAALELAVRRLVSACGDPRKALEQAFCSAPAALEYFAMVEENEPRPSPEAAACARLAEWGAQLKLAAAYLEARGTGIAPEAAMAAVSAVWEELLAAALSGGEAPSVPAAAGFRGAFSALSAESYFLKKKARDLRDNGKIL